MSAPDSRPLPQAEHLGRLWWLPSGGEGNDLDDVGWAPIADIPAHVAGRLLADLYDAGVPAYVAPVTGQPGWRLWVGASRYSVAEDTLRVRLAVLLTPPRSGGRGR